MYTDCPVFLPEASNLVGRVATRWPIGRGSLMPPTTQQCRAAVTPAPGTARVNDQGRWEAHPGMTHGPCPMTPSPHWRIHRVEWEDRNQEREVGSACVTAFWGSCLVSFDLKGRTGHGKVGTDYNTMRANHIKVKTSHSNVGANHRKRGPNHSRG